MAYGTITSTGIPDTPSAESERRQIFFGAAVGLPTFFVRKETHNPLMTRILNKTAEVRSSRRYPGYVRVHNLAYRKALLAVLREDAADLIELMGLEQTIDDLQARLSDFERLSVAGRLTQGIMAATPHSTPLKMAAREFNLQAEQYYRDTLRRSQIQEAVSLLTATAGRIDREQCRLDDETRRALRSVLQDQDMIGLVQRCTPDLLNDQADLRTLQRLANLLLLTVHIEQQQSLQPINTARSEDDHAASVHRANER
jgi:hypothetical protein